MKFKINISPKYADYNHVLAIINKINNKEDVSKDLRKLYGLYQDIPEVQSTIRDHDLYWSFLSSNVILSEEFIREKCQ